MTQCTHVQPPTKPSHALLCSSASAYTPTLSAVPAPPAIDVAGDGYDFMDNGWKDLEDTISPELCMRNARADAECVDTGAISWGKTDAYISTWGGYLANKASSIKCDGHACHAVMGNMFETHHEGMEAFTGWKSFGDGHLEYIVLDPAEITPMTFDSSKATPAVFGSRVGQDETYSTSAMFEGRTEIYQTPGDMFVFTVHRENGGAANVGVTYEFAEEI